MLGITRMALPGHILHKRLSKNSHLGICCVKEGQEVLPASSPSKVPVHPGEMVVSKFLALVNTSPGMFCNTFQGEDHIWLWRDHLGWLFSCDVFLCCSLNVAQQKNGKMLEDEKWMRETRKRHVKEIRIGEQFFSAVRMPQIWAPLLSQEILQGRLFSKLPGLVDVSFVVHFCSNLYPRFVVPPLIS